jgi:hypothetical protein
LAHLLGLGEEPPGARPVRLRAGSHPGGCAVPPGPPGAERQAPGPGPLLRDAG